MTAPVRVRLVPKTPTGLTPQPFGMATMAADMAGELSPAKGHAITAFVRSQSELHLDAKMTPTNRVELEIPADRFSQLFQAELREAKVAQPAGDTPRMVPETELRVPPSLADTIAFAYVPTPPEFFAVSHVPPKVAFHYLSLQDVVTTLRAGSCHRRGWTGRNVRVAMTDTGFARHPFFDRQGYLINRVHRSTTDPSVDLSGHGTGESANVLVVAPDCQLIGVKHDDYSAQALETALLQEPRVITNSWGWNIDAQSMQSLRTSNPNQWHEVNDVQRIIEDATAQGVTFVFSAGNGHRSFPACLSSVVAVGGAALEEDGRFVASDYASSFHSQLVPGRVVPDLCGLVGHAGKKSPQLGHIMLPVPPGSKLDGSNLPDGLKGRGWGVFSGTSAAAPQIAGVIALMLSAHDKLTPSEIRSVLVASTVDVTEGTTALGDVASPGLDVATGAGLIDALSACLQAEQRK
jgi:serine protease AprX